MGSSHSEEGSGDGQDESLARVEAGGIPLAAESRLRRAGADAAAFTSSLSVPEFALLEGLGATAVAQVLGTSIYHVGWQYLPPDAQWGGLVYCELDRVSHAWDQARRRAFARLAEEASLVGADAVVGVRLRRGEHDWARQTVDYVLSGTAVRYAEQGSVRSPALSNLSVQDYWKLRCEGWAPVGLVASAAVFFIAQSTRAKWRRRATVAKNQELREFSLGFAAARERAVRRLHHQADAVNASGIVGVRLEHRVSPERVKVAIPAVRRTGVSPTTIAIGGGYQAPTGKDKREGLLVTVHVVGTAIRREAPTEDASPIRPVVRLGG